MGISLLLASALAGSISRAVVHPLDTLRSRLMVSTASTNMINAFRDIVRTDGFRGLYRGFGISVTIQAPAIATYLSTYEYSKSHIAKKFDASPASPLVHLSSGITAEFVSCFFWVPMEVIKQRAQVRTGRMAASNARVIAKDLIAREGPRALYKGFWLTIGVFGPYAMIYWVVYERLKSMGTKPNAAKRDMNFQTVATSASIASAVAAGCTTPLDVIKTRLQTQGDVLVKNTKAYNGTWDACRVIARQEGLQGFLRGFSARVLWIMPGSAITMTAFEFMKSKFRLGPDR